LVPSLAATAAAFLLAPQSNVRAQLGEVSRCDQVVIGNANLTIDVIGWARARDSVQQRVDEAMWTNVLFLQQGMEVHRLAATAISSRSGFYGSASLKRGGLTVRYDQVAASAKLSYSSSGNVTLHSQQSLSGFPVTVSLTVGHVGIMGLSLNSFGGNTGCSLSGRMESHPYPYAWASLPVAAVTVGVQQDLRFGHQTFAGEVGAYMGYLSTALLRYDVTAMRLLARLLFAIGPVTTPITLVDASAAARAFAPFLP
jgi:hypothetical protein